MWCWFGRKKAVEVVELGVACYPADLDEMPSEEIKVSEGDAAETESDVVAVRLDGWFWLV